MRAWKRKMSDSPNSDYSELELDGGGKEDEQRKPEEVRIPPPPFVYHSVRSRYKAEKVAKKFRVPPEYGLCSPRAEQKAHAPPPGYAAIYVHHFRHGLSLPLPPFVVSLLAHYRIALAQLHPLCIFPILGFLEICNKVSVAPTVALFRHFFRIVSKAEGCYTFCAIPPKIVFGYPICAKNWKRYFLFFKTENVTLSWNHSPVAEMAIAENERPCKQIVSMFLANVVEHCDSKETPTGKKCLDRGSQVPPVPSLRLFGCDIQVNLPAPS